MKLERLVIEKVDGDWPHWATAALSYVQMKPSDTLDRLLAASQRRERLSRQFADQPGSLDLET